MSFHFGSKLSSHHYPYYRPYYHHTSKHSRYSRYTYGYGYNPYRRGYYSSYYKYAPTIVYRASDTYYSPGGAYYYPSGRATVATTRTSAPTGVVYSAPARRYVPIASYAGLPYAGAWTDLARGNARSAFRVFSNAAARDLDAAEPKVGYALAAASLGDHSRAAWAMRRALTTDPYALTEIRFDERVVRLIDRLAEDYARRADTAGGADADFMLATLSFLIHDYDIARVAAESAIERGDRSDAARVLLDMIPDASYDG